MMWKTMMHLPDDSTKRLCGAFNGKRGCTNGKTCAKGLHICAVMLGEKRICGSKTHGACGHELGGAWYTYGVPLWA